ncbi:hypothetical protein J6590_090990 [Homalodisca vitripennis]|nr:hypothetical protein J6590_090990 [Homalodisca vitripennis]
MPIGDGEERKYSIVLANASEASMIPLVGSGSRLMLAAAADMHEDEEDRPPVTDPGGEEEEEAALDPTMHPEVTTSPLRQWATRQLETGKNGSIQTNKYIESRAIHQPP